MIIIVCFLLFFFEIGAMEQSQPIIIPNSHAVISINSMDDLRSCNVDITTHAERVFIEDVILAQAIQKFIFADDSDLLLRASMQRHIVDLKKNNEAAYQNLQFYTLYKTNKLKCGSSDEESLTFTYDQSKIKRDYSPCISLSRNHAKEIARTSYQELMDKKDKEKRYVLYAGIASTLITATTSILTTYFTVKSQEEDCT